MCILCARAGETTSWGTFDHDISNPSPALATASLPFYSNGQIADVTTIYFWTAYLELPHRFQYSQSITVNIDALTADGQALARLALQAWEDVCNVHFVYTSGDAWIEFDDDQPGAFNEFDTYNGTGGAYTFNVRMNVSTAWLATHGTGRDSNSYETYLHEIGHALGLGHTGYYNEDATYGVDNHFVNDTTQYSVMSYFGQDNDGTFAPIVPLGDVLWRHGEGGVATATGSLGIVSTSFQIRGTGDFDGDGDDDILWRHNDGMVVTWEMENGALFTNHNLPQVLTSFQIAGTGDFRR